MNINYGKANLEELDKIVKLVNNAIEKMNADGIRQWDELYPTKEDFKDDIESGSLYTGRINGEIVVVFAINKSCDEEYADGKWQYPDADFRVVHRLCVDTRYQNRGIAGTTVEYIERIVKETGAEAIRLDTFSENPYALRLYRKHGFSDAGTMRLRKGLFFLFEKRL